MDQQLEQLEKDGYAVFPQFLDSATTARLRSHLDSLVPPVAPVEDAEAQRLQLLRHPIPGSIMAEMAINPPPLKLARELLYAQDLRLLEQVLIRTDPQLGERGAESWHIDMAFFPSNYKARPRQTYFHMVHSLNKVVSGGGAFSIVPGSHRMTYAATAEMETEDELKKLQANPAEVAGVDTSDGIEVLAQEGDLVVFNPMALHSASRNVGTEPRYVYFASYFDASAEMLHRRLREQKIRDDYPDSLRHNVPAELQYLLEY